MQCQEGMEAWKRLGVRINCIEQIGSRRLEDPSSLAYRYDTEATISESSPLHENIFLYILQCFTLNVDPHVKLVVKEIKYLLLGYVRAIL